MVGCNERDTMMFVVSDRFAIGLGRLGRYPALWELERLRTPPAVNANADSLPVPVPVPFPLEPFKVPDYLGIESCILYADPTNPGVVFPSLGNGLAYRTD